MVLLEDEGGIHGCLSGRDSFGRSNSKGRNPRNSNENQGRSEEQILPSLFQEKKTQMLTIGTCLMKILSQIKNLINLCL